jgi:hypothetical protein
MSGLFLRRIPMFLLAAWNAGSSPLQRPKVESAWLAQATLEFVR